MVSGFYSFSKFERPIMFGFRSSNDIFYLVVYEINFQQLVKDKV